MTCDGFLADEQRASNVSVCTSFCNQHQDLQLPGGQGGEVAVHGQGTDGMAGAGGEPLDQPPRDRGRQQGVTGADQADGGGQMLGSDVLERWPVRIT